MTTEEIAHRRVHYDVLVGTIVSWKELKKVGVKISDYKISKKIRELKQEFPNGKPQFV